MLFKIKRASEYLTDNPPHSKAQMMLVPYISCTTNERMKKELNWYEEGNNHTSEVDEEGIIRHYRTLQKRCWCISVSSFEELLSIHDSVIVENPVGTGFQIPQITVYDDYVE